MSGSERKESRERRLSGQNRPGFTKHPSIVLTPTFETVDELDDYDLSASRDSCESLDTNKPTFLSIPGADETPTGGNVNPAFSTVDALDEIDQKYRKISQISMGRGMRRKLSQSQSVPMPTILAQNDNLGTVDELDALDQKYLRKASVAVRPSRTPLSTSPELIESISAKPKKEYYFKKRVGRTNKVLLSLAILFFITTEVMVSVYLLEIYKEPPPKPCLTEACLTKGKLMISSIKLNANPCSNFYEYACGNFQQNNFHAEQHRDMQDLMDNELFLRMHHILNDFHNVNTSKEDFERKAGQFHQLCVDSDEEKVANEIVKILQDIEWSVLTNVISESIEIESTLKEAHQHGIAVLFRELRLPNPAQPENPFWVLREGQLPMPRQLYQNPIVMKAYLKFVREMIGAVRNVETAEHSQFRQFDELSDEQLREAIVDFEIQLSTVSHEPDYFKVSVSEFYRTYPSLSNLYHVPFFLGDLADEAGQPQNLTGDTIFIMKDRDYFKTLNDALGKSHPTDSKINQKIYLGWRILYHYLELLQDDARFKHVITSFWQVIGKPNQSKFQRCARLVTEALPDGGVALYSKRYFQLEQTRKARQLFDKLTVSAIELVDNQNWIEEADRKTAKNRFQNLTRQLPFSDDLFSKNLTNQLYSQGTIQYDSFFLTLRGFQRLRQNFVNTGMFSTDIKFNNLLDFKFGADYRLETSEHGIIGVFPKSFIPPFNDPSYPDFAQYSQLGFTYARELAHIVDYQWFKLNKSNTGEQAPCSETLERYQMRLGSLLQHYRNVTQLLNMPSDNETLYEDSADQAALRLAYRAYQKVIKDTHDSLLPGLTYENYSFEQMFFLSLAQKFCENEDSLHIKERVHIGFSQPKVRLTAMVLNSDEFNTAFHCGKEYTLGTQLFDIPNPPRKVRYQKEITAKQINEWYHWFERKPGLPTWNRA